MLYWRVTVGMYEKKQMKWIIEIVVHVILENHLF